MWRVIFMTGCDAVLVDENRKTYKVRLEWPEHYEEIIQEAFEKGQEITFADYRSKEDSDFYYNIPKVEISSLYGEQKEDSNFIKSDNYINVVESWYKT